MHIIWFVAFERYTSRHVSRQRGAEFCSSKKLYQRDSIHVVLEKSAVCKALSNFSWTNSLALKRTNTKAVQNSKTKSWLLYYVSYVLFFSIIEIFLYPESKKTNWHFNSKATANKVRLLLYYFVCMRVEGPTGPCFAASRSVYTL
jgi:hypothetical protein